jgi:hypothetical protein
MHVSSRRKSISVWDEEGDDFNVDEESEHLPRERWDKWLMPSSEWPYKQDLKVGDLKKQ